MNTEVPVEPNWDDLVPEVVLRPEQRESLSDIFRELYVDDKQYVLFQAPTGIGKSIAQLALMRYEASVGRGGFMTTPQRALQDQMRGWAELAIMKGKGSYTCSLNKDLTAALAPCRLSQSIREAYPESCSDSACPFYRALAYAKETKACVHNYASLMAQSHLGRHFGQRGLLCLDEGHTAVSWIRNYMTMEISPTDMAVLTDEDPPSDLRQFMPWFRSVLSGMDRDPETDTPIVPQGAPDNLRLELMKAFTHYEAIGIPTRYKQSEECGEDTALVPWATLWHDPDKWHQDGYWSMIPIRVRPMSHMLLGLGRKVLVVSATVLNPTLFRLELGLDKGSYGCVIVDSAFEPDSRPIKKRYAGKMSFRYRDRTMPKLVKKLEEIARHHRDEPGMIHTVSHQLSWQLWNELKDRLDRPVVMLPRGPDRDITIRRFLSGALGPAAVLIGPSLMEGVDGKDESCRWQALCKVPWPSRNDPVVKHLLDSPRPRTREWGSKWYTWKAAQQTVQGVGRVCRSHTDYGVTYLMDSGFEKILRSGYVPKYILSAVAR